jgi:hypothetical protein
VVKATQTAQTQATQTQAATLTQIAQSWTPTSTPTYTPTASPTITATFTASPALSPTPTVTPSITPQLAPTALAAIRLVDNYKPVNCIDYLLAPNSTGWTAVPSSCTAQPCVGQLSIPETSATTWRYWTSLSAVNTPTVPGNPVLPGDLVWPIPFRANEYLWYSANGNTTVSGSAQVCR